MRELAMLLLAALAAAPADAQSVAAGIHIGGRVQGGCRVSGGTSGMSRLSCTVPLVRTDAARPVTPHRIIIVTPLV